MRFDEIFRQLGSAVSAFGCAQRGNVAITFALAALPIVGTVGFAVDYSHANQVKAAMQAALDSTALMLSKDAATISNAALQTKASTYFKALFTPPEASNVAVSATYSTDGGSKVVVDGSADVATSFLGIIGYEHLKVDGSATAAWGSSRLRVALVLDNTGSMASDGKMKALKSATKSLLSQLKGAASTNGDVYVSIIPFAKDVNVGKSNYNADWIDWTQWDDENKTCNGFMWGNNCYGKWVAANHNSWNGCVTDRGPSNGPGNSDYDQTVEAPGSPAESKFPAEQYDACPVAMKGLSYDWAAMNSLIDSMDPNGGTNQPIGLVWGWQSLVGGGPLSAPGKDSNYTYQDVIVLMSDGLNTQDRWFGNGSNVSTAVDNRMFQTGNGSGTCANIKNADVTIYTIQVNTGGDPTSTLLKNCAGGPEKFNDPSKFFMVTTSSGLGTVFNTIGTNLTKLRVAE